MTTHEILTRFYAGDSFIDLAENLEGGNETVEHIVRAYMIGTAGLFDRDAREGEAETP
jgi:hypothetical protein